MHNLAILMHKLKRFMEAEKLYKQALTVRTAHLGAEHPDTVATNTNLKTLNSDKIRLGSRLSRLNTAARVGTSNHISVSAQPNSTYAVNKGISDGEKEAEYADNIEIYAQPRPDAATNRGAYVTSAGGKRSLASPGENSPRVE